MATSVRCPPVALALQGGGSHGAFTWGVLDRLLEDVATGDLRIKAISGSSAGAMNAALLALGLAEGSDAAAAERTRGLLAAFWTSLGQRALSGGNAFLGGNVPTFLQAWTPEWSPTALALEIASLIFSPYDYPFYSNPLVPLLGEIFTAKALKQINGSHSPKLHVCAVDVSTNQRRIFTQPKISVETLLASACLPNQFQVTEIDGRIYWDGAYMGNPALEPLLTHAQDIIVVMLNPMRVSGMPPRTARQILDRLNEITMNTPLVLEINAIHVVNKLLKRMTPPQVKASGYKTVRLHFIRNDKYMQGLGLGSKEYASPAFLDELFHAGRDTANTWACRHRDQIGKLSTCNWKKTRGLDVEAEIVDPLLKGTPPAKPAPVRKAR